MPGHTATTLAFVRTEAGVVQVDPKGTVPDDALPEHVEQLIDAGVLVDAAEPPVTPAKSASKAEWVAFSTHEDRGDERLTDEDAEALNRDELAARYLSS